MIKTILRNSLPFPKTIKNAVNTPLQRNFFAYLRIAFNKVDEGRLAEVGPDRLCSEW